MAATSYKKKPPPPPPPLSLPSLSCPGWRPPPRLHPPPAACDPIAIQPYLNALENPAYPPAEFHWRAPSAASVTADLRPGQILSVQMSWDRGWNASVDGRPVPIRGDKLGQVVVEPRCSGPCTVELNYDGGAEGRWARTIQRLAFGAGALWILRGVYRRRKNVSA